ncbi:hypothetical protein NPIL_411241 [Nephila pilipes]|uniref:Uncharacterized protein n=1 Tax=Nephila pilipes TaxID=299642 RepID=A0A8X6IKC6_NEPPI|nr:hypothetical protein NPIL_411241 [Nephila pilipes]
MADAHIFINDKTFSAQEKYAKHFNSLPKVIPILYNLKMLNSGQTAILITLYIHVEVHLPLPATHARTHTSGYGTELYQRQLGGAVKESVIVAAAKLEHRQAAKDLRLQKKVQAPGNVEIVVNFLGSAEMIRAHYEQLLKFQRSRNIGLKEAGWANRRIALHMGRSDVAISRCWQEWVDSGRF